MVESPSPLRPPPSSSVRRPPSSSPSIHLFVVLFEIVDGPTDGRTEEKNRDAKVKTQRSGVAAVVFRSLLFRHKRSGLRSGIHLHRITNLRPGLSQSVRGSPFSLSAKRGADSEPVTEAFRSEILTSFPLLSYALSARACVVARATLTLALTPPDRRRRFPISILPFPSDGAAPAALRNMPPRRCRRQPSPPVVATW